MLISRETGERLKEDQKIGAMVTEKVKLYLAMLCLQLCYAGFHIVSRTALSMGVSKVVFPVYRNIIALLLLSPFAYFLEKKKRPPLTFSLLVQIFLLALCGITANQGFYLLGLDYASPTLASAMQNSVPAITFIMAAALRLEHLDITRRNGIAKVLGTISCIGGATTITLFKGSPILLHQLPSQLGTRNEVDGSTLLLSSRNMGHWTLGCIYLLGNCIAWSGWIVLQGPVLRKYPARLSLTSLTCIFGLIQFVAIAAIVERDVEHWKILSGGELLTILYAGLVASGISFSIQIWCIDKGGPLFVAVFQPVQTVLVAIMASLLLGDQLYVGGAMGAVLIISGLYFVLWGKSTEKQIVATQDEESILTKPFLCHESQDQSGRAASKCDVP